MKQQLSKVYEPEKIQDMAAGIWSSGGFFHPDRKASRLERSYAIVIPPPNVTAPLHLGHALNNTLQDILIRFRRMQGFDTLWMPGTDHAGIATQTVVEKRILAEEGKKRTDFNRDDFVGRIQTWKDQYEKLIIGQLQAMGCSCDWQRTRFTMDPVCARAVRTAFFNLFRDGLIYRGKRLVNWDPATQTVLADDELDHETIDGHFWYLKYPLAEPVHCSGGTITHVTVATTRPETMLGDTAIAVNPSDPRADALVGRHVILPIAGRLIPIIADQAVVLPDSDSEDEKARLSTGFLKVTPAHDPVDWEIGQRHGLEIINIMAPDGSISDRHGWTDAGEDAQFLLGMDRFEAREAIVEWFRRENLLEDVRPYRHEVGHSYRSHVPVEPYLSDQWFVAVRQPIERLEQKFGSGCLKDTQIPSNCLAGMALKPILEEKLRFTPARYARTYHDWLKNLRDWPISRQLWWGHRIPVWHKTVENIDDPALELVAGMAGNDNAAVQAWTLETPRQVAVESLQSVCSAESCRVYVCLMEDDPALAEQLQNAGLSQDPDVLDTWFSSALWPFSTLGWPQRTTDLKRYYPTDVLCTAREIITLWVSRMVMMGQYCLGDIPFADVYIHAMIQDGKGRKMSKSLGNGIDPLVVINSHGADAMRFTLASMTTEKQDIRMPVKAMKLPDGRKANTSDKFDTGRNFCNKLWNAARFVMGNIDGLAPEAFDELTLNVADRWILSALDDTIRRTTSLLEDFRYSEATDTLYRFFWNDFCDWYLEWTKPALSDENRVGTVRNVLAFVTDQLLRILHPFVPFITEGLFQKLNEVAPVRRLGTLVEASPAEALVAADWPPGRDILRNEQAAGRVAILQAAVKTLRDLRGVHGANPAVKMEASAVAAADVADVLNENSELVCRMANLSSFSASSKRLAGDDAAASILENMEIYLHGARDEQAALQRLENDRQRLEQSRNRLQARLANHNYVARADPAVVDESRNQLAETIQQLEVVETHISKLKRR